MIIIEFNQNDNDDVMKLIFDRIVLSQRYMNEKKQHESTATPIINNKSRHEISAKEIQNSSKGKEVNGKYRNDDARR